ncbi:MAG: polyphosphate kinase 1 [bacterium]|nr:polyphosphate kinase 1 [bacterium]
MPEIDLADPSLYFNRELSWLAFNRRVLEEARDPSQPPLERLKFLAIFGSNLDEFMMIRYAGLKEQQAPGVNRAAFDGLTPAEQLAAVSAVLHPMVLEHRRVLRDEVLPGLAARGVVIRDVRGLDEVERAAVERFWTAELFPVLTPLAVDSGHPFPRLPNLSFSLLLEVVDEEDGAKMTAIVQVPSVLPRFLRLPGDGYDFVMLEDVIRQRVAQLFPGHAVPRVHAFRITRDADIAIAEDEAADLLQLVEDEVRRRRWGDAVRLEVVRGMPAAWVEQLRRTLQLQPEDVYEIPNHLNVVDFMELAQLPIPELRDPPTFPRLPRELRRHASVFDAVRERDVLLHHPFHAFDAVLGMLEETADDPDVLAIKQTLYRVGRRSPVVAALARAAGNGKLVTALVELKARFDEENNIVWARELERAGVHVVYGLAGLKTRAKALLVVRRERSPDGGSTIRRYVHLGTGNYNPVTAVLYTDMGLLTCDPDLGADVSELFNSLTGFSKQRAWRKLWIAPETLRGELIAAIDREAEHARAGRRARIAAKMNALVDPEVIQALYRASRAGVDVDLLIRGVCCLRPGIPGVSERIQVRSIVGRFLEHARFVYFEDGGAGRVHLSSADWMQRNLNARVETVFPIEDPRLKREVLAVLDLGLRDNVKARELLPNGEYVRARRRPGQRRLDSQARLLERSRRRGESAD